MKNSEGRDADRTQHQRRRGGTSIRRVWPKPEQQIDVKYPRGFVGVQGEIKTYFPLGETDAVGISIQELKLIDGLTVTKFSLGGTSIRRARPEPEQQIDVKYPRGRAGFKGTLAE